MKRGEPRGAEGAVLLLRMLEDQERHLVVDRRDAVADAQRQRFAAVGALRHLFNVGAGLEFSLGFGLF